MPSLLSFDKRLERVEQAMEDWAEKRPPSSQACFIINVYALLDAMKQKNVDGHLVFTGNPKTGDVFHVYGLIGKARIDPWIEKAKPSIAQQVAEYPIIKQFKVDKLVANESQAAHGSLYEHPDQITFTKRNPKKDVQIITWGQTMKKKELRTLAKRLRHIAAKLATAYAEPPKKYQKTPFNKWFATFLEEKQLPVVEWTIRGPGGTPNYISNEVVIETIMNSAPSSEQKKIKDMIVKLDFKNADINDFLKHLAGALARDM